MNPNVRKQVDVLNYINNYNNSIKRGKILVVEHNKSFCVVNLTKKDFEQINKNYNVMFNGKNEQYLITTQKDIEKITGVKVFLENRYSTFKEFQEEIKPLLDQKLIKHNIFNDILNQIKNPIVNNGVKDYTNINNLIESLSNKQKQMLFIDYMDFNEDQQAKLIRDGFSKDIIKECNQIKEEEYNRNERIISDCFLYFVDPTKDSLAQKRVGKNLSEIFEEMNTKDQERLINYIAERFNTLPHYKDNQIQNFLSYNQVSDNFITKFLPVYEKKEDKSNFNFVKNKLDITFKAIQKQLSGDKPELNENIMQSVVEDFNFLNTNQLRKEMLNYLDKQYNVLELFNKILDKDINVKPYNVIQAIKIYNELDLIKSIEENVKVIVDKIHSNDSYMGSILLKKFKNNVENLSFVDQKECFKIFEKNDLSNKLSHEISNYYLGDVMKSIIEIKKVVDSVKYDPFKSVENDINKIYAILVSENDKDIPEKLINDLKEDLNSLKTIEDKNDILNTIDKLNIQAKLTESIDKSNLGSVFQSFFDTATILHNFKDSMKVADKKREQIDIG